MSSEFSHQEDPTAFFEEVWNHALAGGKRPHIKAFLNPDVPPWAQRTLLQQLLAIDLSFRKRLGEQPAVAEYTRELSEYGPIIETLFQDALESTQQSDFVPDLRAPMSRDPSTGFSTTGSAPASHVQPKQFQSSTELQESRAKQLGPYSLDSSIGEGAFGQVWLATHKHLQEKVAVKILTRQGANQASALIEEAKALLPLVHPNIVRFYHAEVLEDCSYIVMEYVPGGSLKNLARSKKLLLQQSITLVRLIAEGLGHAHKHGIIHRDLKPANILLTTDLQPKIADFGMAMNYANFGSGIAFAGTPNYMSPEQARGESHRVDGRTDIFALGVIFYELITNSSPFGADDVSVTIDRIIHSEPRPPRQIIDTIPAEVERICLKCLEKKLPNRYGSTAELLDDLRALSDAPENRPPTHWHSAKNPQQEHVKVIPRGLRSFERDDAEFFLELWPGPRDRHGNPEIIRSWKSRLESRDAATACSVGIVYGPSGTGKSSLIRAGLIPKLGKHVDVLVCDANSVDTELQLAKAIRDLLSFDSTTESHVLSEIVLSARQEYQYQGKKLLIVIDQLEQYLHANPTPEDGLLAGALRQCDGPNVQALLVVRDDFWLSLQRLMLGAEVPLQEGINMSLVDRFDPSHGRQVLKLLGEAHNCLPSDQPLTLRQESFLDRAIEILSDNQRLTPIQISIFVEMLKHSEWTPKSLQGFTSVSELGILFLDDCFGDGSPVRRSVHASAAMQVLNVLASGGSQVRSGTRSYSELLAASGYSLNPRKFTELLSILVNELRLISPAEQLKEFDSAESPMAYQLTHDFLVSAVKAWLQKRLSMSRSGRAQLLLEQRAKDWQVSRTNRALPDFFEYLNAIFWTWRFPKNPTSAQMLRRCHLLYGRRLLFLACAACAFLLLVMTVRNRSRETLYRTEIEYLVGLPADQLVPKIAELRSQAPAVFQEIVEQHLQHENMSAPERVRLLIASLPSDSAVAELHSILASDTLLAPPLLSVVVHSLHDHRAVATDILMQRLQNDDATILSRFQMAIAIQQLEIEQQNELHSMTVEQSSSIAPHTQDAIFNTFLAGLKVMEPTERRLYASSFPNLVEKFRDPILDKYFVLLASSEDVANERLTLINILLDLFPEDPKAVIPLLRFATKNELGILLPTNPSFDSFIVSRLAEDLESWKHPDLQYHDLNGFRVPRFDSPDREMQRIGIANLLVASLCNGVFQSDAFDLEKLSALQVSPEVQIANSTSRYIVSDRSLLGELLDRIDEVPSRRINSMGEFACSRLSEPSFWNNSDDIFYLLLIVGRLSSQSPNQPWLQDAIAQATRYQTRHPDAGVHSAATWLLKQCSTASVPVVPPKDAAWRLSPSEQLMIRFVSTSQNLMGSPSWEPGRDSTSLNETEIEQLRLQPITLPFEISATEVTNRFFRMHFPEYNQNDRIATNTSDDCPAAGIRWNEAAEFCNRLSQVEGIPPEEWAYDEATKQFKIERTGYRLPTSVEWEFACRSHSLDMFAYGNSHETLRNYAWFIQNSMKDRLNPVGSLMPNRFGLFDMHGNIAEYCADDPIEIAGDNYRTSRGGAYDDRWSLLRAAVNIHTVNDDHPVVLGSLGFRIARTVQSPKS